MAILEMETQRKKGTLRGRESRNQTLTTKLTETEFETVETASRAEGKTVGEWLRDVALRGASADTGDGSNGILLAEVIGVRLLLVNVLRPMATGQKLTPESFDKLLDEIGRVKHDLAEKLAPEGRK